jgi:hypothetical protein
MTRIEETKTEARQGETSYKHRVFKILIVSTGLAALALFLGATFLV